MPERSFGKFICIMSHSVEKRESFWGTQFLESVTRERNGGFKAEKGRYQWGNFWSGVEE